MPHQCKQMTYRWWGRRFRLRTAFFHSFSARGFSLAQDLAVTAPCGIGHATSRHSASQAMLGDDVPARGQVPPGVRIGHFGGKESEEKNRGHREQDRVRLPQPCRITSGRPKISLDNFHISIIIELWNKRGRRTNEKGSRTHHP